MDIMKRLQEHYDIAVAEGHDIVGVFLQGSQNYGLAYEDSDIDSKAIVLPSFNDFCIVSRPISETLILDNDEHIDLKDIRLMFQCFKKQNINFIEILFTKYKVMNPAYEQLFQPMIDNNEKIARYDIHRALNCITGMSMEKLKALKHPYPSTKDKIEKFGFDPKQLSHILRLNNFIERYIKGIKYSDCLISEISEYMIKVKKGLTHSLLQAEQDAKFISNLTYEMAKEYKNTHDETQNIEVAVLMNQVLIAILKDKFAREVQDEV